MLYLVYKFNVFLELSDKDLCRKILLELTERLFVGQTKFLFFKVTKIKYNIICKLIKNFHILLKVW